MKTLTSDRQIAVKNIMFATDFEVSAGRALPFAVALAKRFGAKLCAVHVIPREAYAFVSPESVDRVLAEAGDFAGYTLNQIVGPLRSRGLPCDTLLGEGDVAAVVEEFAQMRAADLLVVGTSRHAALGRMLLGSVAEELIRDSPCPVLTVGPHVTTLASDGVHTIVCPTDFSGASNRATKFAVSLAEEYQAHLTLVHVIQGGAKDSLHLTTQLIEKRIFETIPPESELQYPPEIVVEIGSVSERILNLASDLSADVIVMGVRGVGSFGQMASRFGSIAHKVVSLSPCPVLTVSDLQKHERQ